MLLGDSLKSSTVVCNERVQNILRSALPSKNDMKLVLGLTEEWWESWQLGYPGVCVGDQPFSLTEFVFHALDEGYPTDLAIVLLCFAMSLHHLPLSFDLSKLQQVGSVKTMTGECLEAAAYVTTDDDLAGSIEGLECLILQSKLYLVMEQPRKSWLGYRRAVNIAESLKLHRSTVRLASDFDHITSDRKQSVWWQIYQADRALSLLLGFSIGIPDTCCNLDLDEPTNAKNYIRKVAAIGSRIAERNQANSVNIRNGHALTKQIECQLDDLIEQMPANWRDTSRESVERDGRRVWVRLLPQLWHYQMAVLLHLPYMLRSGSNPTFLHHKFKCLEAAREMTTRFLIMNDRTRCALRSCKTVEFQAFISTVVIVINMLGKDNNQTQYNDSSSEKDCTIVNNMIRDLRKVSKDHNAVEFRAAEVLMALKAIGQNEAETGRAFKVNIPYFGSITIARRVRPNTTIATALSPLRTSISPETSLATTQLDLVVAPMEHPPTAADSAASWPTISFIGGYLSNGSETGTSVLEHMVTFGAAGNQFSVDLMQGSDLSCDWILDDLNQFPL